MSNLNALCRCGHPAERHGNGLGYCSRNRECNCWSFKHRQPFRDELVAFAVWLLREEPGEGHEEELVDTYLAGLSGAFRAKVTNLILNGEHYEEVDGDDG